MRRHIGQRRLQHDGKGLQVGSPPRETRTKGRQIEGLDGGGHDETTFRRWVQMKTPAPQQSSAAVGVLCAIAAATVFSTAGVVVRRVELPAWDVSFWRATLLVATILPLLVWQR